MSDLRGIRVAILATDGVEESELGECAKALRDAGARVEVVAPHEGEIQTFRHFTRFGTWRVDLALEALEIDDYDALVLPGGTFHADLLRAEPKARDAVRAMADMGRPVAAIGHAAWLLISARVARGRRLTGAPTLEDDLRNAGAEWEDLGVLVDGPLVTGRGRGDLPEFIVEMLRVFRMSAAPKPVRKPAEPPPVGRLGTWRKAGRRAGRRNRKSPGSRLGGRSPGLAESQG